MVPLLSKASLRRRYLDAAASLPPETRRRESEAIARALTGSAWFQAAKTVFIYVSTPFEPDTSSILKAAFAAGKTVLVPRCLARPGMLALPIREETVLAPGPFGVPEPPLPADLSDLPSPDLAVVPCVAAAKNGARLGHGGGYYDAFLSAHPCRRVCLCFSETLADNIPVQAHDVPMDAVATPEGIVFP